MSVRVNELRAELLLEYLETVEATDAATEAAPTTKGNAYWYALGKETAARTALESLERIFGRRDELGQFKFDARALLEEARAIREEKD